MPPLSPRINLLSPGFCLGPTFLVVVTRRLACLVPRTWSALTRSPFLGCVSLPPTTSCYAAAALLADSDDEVPFCFVSHLALGYVDQDLLLLLQSTTPV
jgi:hypothetical protein